MEYFSYIVTIFNNRTLQKGRKMTMTAILAKKERRLFGRDKFNRKRLTKEDIEIVAALEALKHDIDFLNNCFDYTTDSVLVDSLVYEIKAANLKYQYYLNLCKEKGIVHGSIPLR